MEAATARIVVQVTPTQKDEIVAQAAKVGLNVSELMRQGAMTYDQKALSDEAILLGMVEQANKSTAAANAALDSALAALAEGRAKRRELLSK
jgi:hypothetical protein